MSRSKAIRQKCLECSGGSPKEVTLCQITDCPLWPFRIGSPINGKRYAKRMEAAARNHPDEYQELMKSLERPDDGRNPAKNTRIDIKFDENDVL